jgi:hypothetical protein
MGSEHNSEIAPDHWWLHRRTDDDHFIFAYEFSKSVLCHVQHPSDWLVRVDRADGTILFSPHDLRSSAAAFDLAESVKELCTLCHREVVTEHPLRDAGSQGWTHWGVDRSLCTNVCHNLRNLIDHGSPCGGRKLSSLRVRRLGGTKMDMDQPVTISLSTERTLSVSLRRERVCALWVQLTRCQHHSLARVTEFIAAVGLPDEPAT